MNNIKIVSNYINEDVYSYSRSFYESLPYEKIGIVGHHDLFAFNFFKHMIMNKDLYDFEWMIYLDEDCFITNPDELQSLLKYQIDNDYYCSGMPDGGVASHRFHNPLAINPFFMILNLKKIREVYKPEDTDYYKYSSEFDRFIPHHLIKTNIPDDSKFNKTIAQGYKPYGVIYDNFETYYQFFFCLLKHNMNILYLDAYDFPNDDFTTVLKSHNGIDFAYHTWYSRNWTYDDNNRKRILNVINHCNSIKNNKTI